MRRIQTVLATLAGGQKGLEEFFRSGCEVAQNLADQLGFGSDIVYALGQVFERWDGRGWPQGDQGEELAISARIVQVAQDAVVFYRLGGAEAAGAVAKERAGTIYDPTISERFYRDAPRLLKGLEVGSVRKVVLEAEPGTRPRLSEAQLEVALRAVANFVDLKSPYTTGHSTGVAELAAAAARCGLPDQDVIAVRRAGFVHDLGRTAVPNRIWEKTGPLTEGEWERIRLHPYFTERMLAYPASLARLGGLAALTHERLDGSGYPRGLSAAMQPLLARVLAAADAYHAMTELRPYRPAHSSESAAEELRSEVRAGRLYGEAVESVLGASGRRSRRRRQWPAGLSAREIEVLRLVSLGQSNRQMARCLSLSERTVAHHVQHIYQKIGVSTRAAATLFAMQHDLLGGVEATKK